MLAACGLSYRGKPWRHNHFIVITLYKQQHNSYLNFSSERTWTLFIHPLIKEGSNEVLLRNENYCPDTCKSDQILGTKQYFWSDSFLVFQSYVFLFSFLVIWFSIYSVFCIRSNGPACSDPYCIKFFINIVSGQEPKSSKPSGKKTVLFNKELM